MVFKPTYVTYAKLVEQKDLQKYGEKKTLCLFRMYIDIMCKIHIYVCKMHSLFRYTEKVLITICIPINNTRYFWYIQKKWVHEVNHKLSRSRIIMKIIWRTNQYTILAICNWVNLEYINQNRFSHYTKI